VEYLPGGSSFTSSKRGVDASVKLHKDLVLRNRFAVVLGDKMVPKLAQARPNNSNYHLFCRVKGFLFHKIYHKSSHLVSTFTVEGVQHRPKQMLGEV
jgi:hypothetical protein